MLYTKLGIYLLMSFMLRSRLGIGLGFFFKYVLLIRYLSVLNSTQHLKRILTSWASELS